MDAALSDVADALAVRARSSSVRPGVANVNTCLYNKRVYNGADAMPVTQDRQAVSINIRAKARQRDLIDQAADRLGRSRSEFMLDAACREAEDVLLDQAYFPVNARTFDKFLALLDRPLPPTDRLRRLLKTKAPWEK